MFLDHCNPDWPDLTLWSSLEQSYLINFPTSPRSLELVRSICSKKYLGGVIREGCTDIKQTKCRQTLDRLLAHLLVPFSSSPLYFCVLWSFFTSLCPYLRHPKKSLSSVSGNEDKNVPFPARGFSSFTQHFAFPNYSIFTSYNAFQ